MKKSLVLLSLLIMLTLTGCIEKNIEDVTANAKNSPTETEEPKSWNLSSEFKSSEGDYLLGEEGKAGLIGPEFKAGKIDKWLWHFWGDEKTIEGGNFKVVAIHKETGEKEKALVENAGTSNEQKVWEYGKLAYSPNGVRGSDSSMPSNMSLSTPGVWRLEIFIGENYFGAIVVDVKKK
ncbi:hypothetical protein D1B31_07600 [Neobacillus notoginsengisoli]|uniref:DUF4871 domain-containing protein n=1 Tax=Neobacillus notoginsengisoli TaxID=1578198 RepID=A0A417YVX4_9BACI|nr:hypothetical protein [Neobacillus notoginsengisoli]RHW41573.1 hypothetical protein D1B31_07600 [Neobacillus notoginsengisoli]